MKKRRILIAAAVFILLLVCCNNSEKKDNSHAGYIPENPQQFYMYIASDGLNVRKGPGADSSVVTVLHRNDKVVTDKISHDGWYRITAVDESAEGYVNAAYLTDKPVSEEEIAAGKTAEKPAPATRSANPDTKTASTAVTAESEPAVQRPTLSKRPKN